MAEFKLGRIKFVYQGTWQTGQSYVVDDVVTVGGKTYICVISHSSSSTFAADLSHNPTYWNLMADGVSWKGAWAASTYYTKGDLVKYGGVVYQCNTAHTSATYTSPTYLGLEADQGKWDAFATSFAWNGAWTTNHRYKVNDLVTYGGYTYVCNAAHTSAADSASGLEADQGKWDTFNAGIIYQGDWAGTTRYKVNDVVKYGADLWICTTQHTSGGSFDSGKFQIFVSGLQFENSWSSGATYQVGDVVTYGGYSYIAKQNHSNQTPSTASSYWDVYTTGFSFQGDWDSATAYKVGHVVRLGGYTYVATADNTNQTPPNGSYWARLNSGLRWAATSGTYTGLSATNISSSGNSAVFSVTRAGTVYSATATTAGSGYAINDTLKIAGTSLGGLSPVNDLTLTVTGVTSGGITAVSSSGASTTWTSGTTYVLGDVVFWGASSYICVSAHVAAGGNRPDADTTATYWNLLANGTETAVLTTKGDMFYYGANGAARLPAGTDGQVLRVSAAGYPAWAYYGQINNLVWVSPSGIDVLDNGQGTTIDKPWKSVRYATQRIEEGYLNRSAGALLAKNKQFITKEINNYVAYTYKATITSANSSNQFVAADTSGLRLNMPVTFTTTVGGVTVGTTYYIKSIDSSTLFTISNTVGGSVRTLSSATGAQSCSYAYDQSKTERDAGYVLDGIVFDITHSGTLKTVKNTRAYYNTAGTGYVSGVYSYDIAVFTEALEYMKTLVSNVLGNVPPASNYQTLNGVATNVQGQQNIDNSLTAESGTTQTSQDLISIVKTGLLAGTATSIPNPITPSTTIRITTGTFNETTPIIVPSYTAVVGDELRTSVVQPASANQYLVNDKPRSVNALTRLKSMIPNLLSNQTVVPTTGNTTAQKTLITITDTGSAAVRNNTNTMISILSGGLGAVPTYTLTTPTGGTGNASDAGYFNGARLVYANKAFIQAEVVAYMVANYNSVWTGLGAAGQAACTRDVGYIVDALRYDLTYGGNLATVIAARSYYSNGTFVEQAGEKTAAVAVQGRIAAIISQIVQAQTVSVTAGNVTAQDKSGTAGSAAAGTFANARVLEVQSTINTGTTPTTITPDTSWVASALTTANTAIQADKTNIQLAVIEWIDDAFPSLVYNKTTCSRDVGYIIDALCYDMMFGSNFLSCWNAMSYYRALTSTGVVLASQLQPTIGMMGVISASVKELTSGQTGVRGSIRAANRINKSANTIYDVFTNGINSLPDFQLPDPTGYGSTLTNATSYGATGYATGSTVGFDLGRQQIIQNYAFLKADVSQYLINNYNTVWLALGATGQARCQRDVGYILDAIVYDMTYGGNTQSLIAGSAYYSFYQLDIASTEKAATVAAYTYLKAQVAAIVTKTASAASGNVVTIVTTGTAGSAAAAAFVGDRVQNVVNWVSNGTADATVVPCTSWVSAQLVAANAALQARRSEIALDSSAWVKKNYQNINFNESVCQRDVGLMVDALGYDMMFGSNYASIVCGMSYYRSLSSTAVVIANQFQAQQGFIRFLKYKAKTIATSGSIATAISNVNDLISYINGGGVPRFQWPDPSNINSGYAAAKMALYDNVDFLKAEVVAYIAANYPAVTYDAAVCKRDVGYLIDAIRYDLTYGGNFASVQAGKKYYSALTSVLEIAAGEKAATLAAYGYLSTIAQSVAQNSVVVSPLQTAVAQVTTKGTQTVGSAGAATQIGTLFTTITNIINNGLTSGVPTLTITTIATNNTFTSNGHGLAVGDMITAQTTTNGLVAGTIYYVQSFTTNTFTLSTSFNGSALSGFTNGTGLSIVVEKTNMPALSPVSSELTSAYATLSAAKATLQTAVTTWLTTNYPLLSYNQATCARDVGYIVDAVAYDFMFNSNFRSVLAGRTYYTAQAALVIAGQKQATIDAYNYLKTQIAATVYASTTAQSRANSLMDIIINIITKGVGTASTSQESPETHGTLTYNNVLGIVNGSEILRANSDFIAAELSAYTLASYSATVTNTTATTNVITTSSAHNLVVGDPVQFTATTVNTTATQTIASTDGSRPNQIVIATTTGIVANMPILFTGTTFGGITQNTTYYVKSVVDSTHITISATSGGTVLTLTGATGSTPVAAGGLFGNLVAGTTYWVLTAPSSTTFTVTASNGGSSAVTLLTASGVATSSYYFNQATCKRDTAEYVKALVYDLQYTGNYKTLQAGMWYNNSVSGSVMQDMFRVRNATGLRNCTLNGLYGGLTNANSYGTKRPTAGAFVALDPGFGPNDQNVWVTERSHYSQNVTMFGTGCTGAKIDAALHNGGYKSMVKNDFTTIISDGIGVWCTGSGSLTELVSVFNYYGYAGYLAEYGGRIRATNGNSSYGTYGVIAEGVDTYETPLYGTVNNQFFQAQLTNTVTDLTNKVLRIEYGNAGQNYTNSVTTISGSGYNAQAIQDEFRDGALFESRIIDLNDGNGYGGTSYVTFANAAQLGDKYSITIAATDTSLSTAYIGMRIQITAGTGVGQYGNVLTYNNGSKIAQVYRDSFTNVTITATTQGTPSTVTVSDTSQMYATMPFYVGTTVGGLQAGTVYFVQSIVNGTTINVSATSGGAALTTAITTTTSQSVTLYAAGWDHVVPGTTIVNALDLTTTYIIEPRISYTAPGYSATARTLSASTTWSNMTYGSGNYLAISSSDTKTSYSTDGKTWTAGGALPSSQNWQHVVYMGGEGATATATLGGSGGSGAVLSVQLGTAGNAVAGADQVLSVTVVQGGTGYTSPPTILFTGGSGSGATATAVLLNGSIAAVNVVIPGSGYISAPTATAYTGTVTGYVMTSWGRNYFSAPTVTVSDPFVGTAWSSGGSAVLNTIYYYNNSGIKNWYTCTSAGTFTTSGPIHQSGAASNGTATLTYIGTTATGTANTNSGTNPNMPGVVAITLGTGGYGYTSVPTVTITDGTARFVAISSSSTNSAYVAPSNIAGAWSGGGALPASNMASLTYGGGVLVTVGGTALAATSSDGGATWVSRTLPTLGSGTYVSVAYGNAGYVTISSGGASAFSSNGVSWTAGGTIPGGTTNWASMTYGNGRFVAIAGGTGGSASNKVAYSLDNGTTWYTSPSGLPASAVWTRVRYGAGLFLAVAEGGTTAATSPDGVTWTLRTMPGTSTNWISCAFGNTNKRPLWAAISRTSGTVAASLRTGAQALGRVKVASGTVTEVRMVEPGSGYPYGTIQQTAATTNVITADNVDLLVDNQPIEFTGLSEYGLAANTTYYVIGSTISGSTFKVSATSGSSTPVTLTTGNTLSGTFRAGPIYTLTDPNKVKTCSLRMRMGDGALGNPSFSNRGTNNTTATAITAGDGFSDLYQPSTFINVAGLYAIPTPGANVEFANIPNTWYKLVSVTNILGTAGNYTAQFQINPSLSVYNAPSQGILITTRLKYSQVRLTGHDFLYIGTGNKQRTNYPYVDTTLAIQANQTNSSGGGRVFFTSTDQDGNFNVGNLFGVQQATGTATLNASAFNLAGLQSLQLGAVSIGVGSAVITQFSTDPYFTANSDSIVPTQRAIKAYITSQIGGGASSLNVNTLTAGVVYLANNTISTTTGVQINVTAKMNFTGGIDGAPVALGFFMQR